MKNIILTSCLIFLLFSCGETFYPSEDSYRDPDVVGTWQQVLNDNNSQSLIVFTEEGYFDAVSCIKNNDTIYTDLDGIWHVHLEYDSLLNYGQLYTRSTTKNFTSKGWEDYNYYKLSINNDTLFFGLEITKLDTFIKNKNQLIYDADNWVGIE